MLSETLHCRYTVLKMSYFTCVVQCVRLQFLDSGRRQAISSCNQWRITNKPPTGGRALIPRLVITWCPCRQTGLSQRQLKFGAGRENCQLRVTLGESRGIKLQHQRRSQGQSWTVCLERGWEGGKGSLQNDWDPISSVTLTSTSLASDLRSNFLGENLNLTYFASRKRKLEKNHLKRKCLCACVCVQVQLKNKKNVLDHLGHTWKKEAAFECRTVM